jgi:hypothetical protein
MSITFEAKTFDVSAAASNLAQASVKLVFGKKVGEQKVFSTNGVATTLPLIWNKDANLLMLTQPANTAFGAGDITDFETQILADGFSQPYADSAKVKFNNFRPCYFSPSWGTLQTSEDILYRRRIDTSDSMKGGAPKLLATLSRKLSAAGKVMEGVYDHHVGTVAEGISYQEGLLEKWSAALDIDAITAIVTAEGGEILPMPATAAESLSYPGCFSLHYEVTPYSANDPRASTNVHYLVRPRVAERYTFSNAGINVKLNMSHGSTKAAVYTNEGEQFRVAFSKINWNFATDTTWTITYATTSGGSWTNPAATYSYAGDVGGTTEAEAMKVVNAMGLPRALVVQISSYLMALDGVSVNNSSLIPDIGYWLTLVSQMIDRTNGLPSGRLAYDPVDDWSPFTFERDMSERDLIFLGYVPSFQTDRNGPIRVQELIVDGFKQAAESSVPLFVISRGAPRTLVAGEKPKIDAWFYRTGAVMEQRFRDLKVAQGASFPSEVTESHFLEVGAKDYMFFISSEFDEAAAAWTNSSFAGAEVDGTPLTVDNTYVTEDDLGELVDYDTQVAKLSPSGTLSNLGGLFILPIDTLTSTPVEYTIEIDSDGSVSLVTPAATLSIERVKALVALGDQTITLVPSAELLAHYANAANALYYAEYEAGDMKNSDAMLVQYVFRKENGLSYGVDYSNSLVFEGLNPQSYYTLASAYTKTGATRNFEVTPKIADIGTIAEAAIIQADIDKAARSMLVTLGQIGLSMTHGL